MTKLLIACALFCGTLIVSGSAIPVSGFGNGGCSFPGDNSYGLSFSGSNGTDSVGMTFFSPAFAGCPWGPNTSSFSGVANNFGGGLGGSGSADIDGVLGDYFNFSIGGGTGELTIFSNGTSNVIAQADLIGYVMLTNYQVLDRFGDSMFDISVLPTPEPSTLALTGIAVAGMLTALPKINGKSQRALKRTLVSLSLTARS
jgi:hypothetical protein